jgi:hypothetical protein
MDSIRFFIHEEEEVAAWVLADFIYFTSNKSTSILLYTGAICAGPFTFFPLGDERVRNFR